MILWMVRAGPLFGGAQLEEVVFAGDEGLLSQPEKADAQAGGDGGGHFVTLVTIWPRLT